MPTIAALAGIRCDAPSIDGEDLSSALRGEPAVRQRPLHWEWFFEVVGNPAYFAPPLAMRDGQWKFYCDYAGGNVQLFDVVNDPSEVSELSAQHPDVVNRLRAAALALGEVPATGRTPHRCRQRRRPNETPRYPQTTKRTNDEARTHHSSPPCCSRRWPRCTLPVSQPSTKRLGRPGCPADPGMVSRGEVRHFHPLGCLLRPGLGTQRPVRGVVLEHAEEREIGYGGLSPARVRAGLQVRTVRAAFQSRTLRSRPVG